MRKISALFILLLTAVIPAFTQQAALVPQVSRPVYFDISPPLRDLFRQQPGKIDNSWKDGVVKNYFSDPGTMKNGQPVYDPALQGVNGDLPSDTTIVNFDGMGNVSGAVPPDTHGDVGMNYYFQVVNCAYSIYNKSGNKILGPLASSTVWTGLPNNSNSGDALVLYDEQANRWLFTQFSLPNGSSTPPFYQMVAVSQTSDPTGSWYRWEYEFNKMPDYPKFGVWPDGYYMSSNFFLGGWAGNGIDAFDRSAMIAGSPEAQRISFTLNPGVDGFSSLLPADCDGAFPAPGTPNYFTFVHTSSPQRLGIYEFHADWNSPVLSTFGNKIYLNVNAFSRNGEAGSGIPQKDSDKKLETLADRLMYRLQFRQFNGYQSMVLNHTVDGTAGHAGLRWYELRNTGTGWSIYQQATYSPADGNSRWMGSIAQDSAGTIAMGYSVSGTNLYPAIRYTGRFKNDPLNQMTMTEKGIINGGGSQTGIWSGRSRWGDYSALSVDPASPTTFWFTTEYYAVTGASNWATRVGSFTFQNVFSSAASANPALMCSATLDSVQLNAYGYGGTGTYTYAWTSIPPGFTSNQKSPKVKPTQSIQYVAAISDGTATRHDTAQVTIAYAPTVSAGPDTIVCWWASPIPLHATATNYSSVAWGTGGDGSFSNPNELNTLYYPGMEDKTSGHANLILMVLPDAPCTGNVKDFKNITLDPCTGIGGPAGPGPALSVQPNPAHDRVTITIAQGSPDDALTVLSTDGRIVWSGKPEIQVNDSRQAILDLGGFAKGLYIVRLQQQGRVETTRFVVE